MKLQSQKGSIEAIVIGVLVVALIGALGWIFWQNVIDKNEGTTPVANEKNGTSREQDHETEKATVQYLEVPEYGIKMEIPDNLKDSGVGYEMVVMNKGTDAESQKVGIKTTATEAKTKACLRGNDGTLVVLAQSDSSQVSPDGFLATESKVNGSYYVGLAQAAYFCQNSDRQLLIDETNRIVEMLKTIESTTKE